MVLLGLAVVGVVDAALVWYPLDPGNPEWEFSVITRTFNGLALATIGIGGLMAVAVGASRRAWIGVASAVCTAAVLAIAAAGVVYLLVIPVAIGAAPDALRQNLYVAVGKTLLYIAVYLAVYGILAGYGWRRFNTWARRS